MQCGFSASGDLVRDHYHGFSHPVLVDLPAATLSDLFSEMNVLADELRANPDDVEGDDQIPFRQLLRLRAFALTRAQFLDLYGLWREFYRARQEAIDAERRARLAELWEERDALFA